ncbi:MerR family transcriptional regulator [Bacillus sp. OK048]|uniref:MerR family transcriptional regulator n=1 Tax=Bacillus sp. OK048 TaxID=1882761 RepID=UPI00088D34DE|nr:MerR family transcriptional regulator [Bacillus sp. OK048]SDN74135.1 DNA-binding transcriptional regulator, MerR family [Bacillus sp. OK048]
MKTFTLKEVSKKINITPATLRKWEKELDEYLYIPRTKQGARIYSQVEIELLLEIKQMYENKLSTATILQTLQGGPELEEELFEYEEELLELEEELSDLEEEQLEQEDEFSDFKEANTKSNSQELTFVSPVFEKEVAIKNANEFFIAMDTYKQTFLNEVKEEIRNVLRKEVVDEVKKEIVNGAAFTVKSLSESINQSTVTTKAMLGELSVHLDKNAEQTTERLLYLSKSIVNASQETSEDIYSLSKQLSESTEELAHYVDITNTEITSLSEAIEKDRGDRGKERELFRHEITQREAAFQNLLTSFRDVAVAKDKKWWKFWE